MERLMNFRLLILLSSLVIAFSALAFTTSAQDAAQERETYKVSDRVEIDPTGLSDKNPSKTWQKGTVIQVSPSGHRITVRIDDVGDGGTREWGVLTGENMIRPLKEAEKNTPPQEDENQKKKVEPEAKKNALPKETEDQTKKVEPEQEQQPAAGACQPSDDTGGNTQSDIFKRLIRKRYEHKPENERDPTTTVTFQSLKPGVAHKWRPGVGGESPDGPGGMFGTTVLPVRAVYTVCTDEPGYKPSGYRGTISTRQDNNTFYCFKNQFGEWQCNLGRARWAKQSG